MKYDKNWYNSLKQPAFQPPAWVFAPVWTVLYIMMAFSFALVLLSPYRQINLLAYVLFVIQLALNFSWAPVFFQYHQIKKAFFICFWLAVFVFLTIEVFYLISKLAALLLLPYLLWVIFAGFLNYKIWKLNGD